MNRKKDWLSDPALQALMSHRELLEEALGLSEGDEAVEERRASIQAAHDNAADALRQALQIEANHRQLAKNAA